MLPRIFLPPTLILAVIIPSLAAAFLGDLPEEMTSADLCEELEKQNFEWAPSAYVKFRPLEEQESDFKYWVLDWNESRVAIPVVEFSHISVRGAQDDSRWLYLASRHAGLIITLGADDYDFSEITSMLGTKSQEFVDRFTFMGMLTHAFSTTPADINCLSDDLISQVNNVAALVMKGLFVYGDDSQVFKDFGPEDGILVKSQLASGQHVELITQADDSTNEIVMIGYKNTENSYYKDFYLTMNTTTLVPESSPDWLQQLEASLRAWDIPNIKRLAESQGWKYIDMRPDATKDVVNDGD